MIDKQLNSGQLDTLKDDFVDLQIDSMDMECLIELASDYLYNSYHRLTQTDMKERIVSLYTEETYYELVDNIVTEDIPLIDNNNPYKSIPSRY